MAKLVISLNEVHRKICTCSNCGEYIASPSNGVVYKHCYNCGAKFETPISAKIIRKKKEGKIMEFKFEIVGYDTIEWGSVRREIVVEAENEIEARAKAKQWCKDHSSMGGYDYYVENIISEVK